MDSKILKVLKSYKFSDSEINDVLTLCPMFDVLTHEEFGQNCYLLVSFGYPKSELDFLILSNPSIFARSAKDLEADLKKLSAKTADIEQALKQNPMCI